MRRVVPLTILLLFLGIVIGLLLAPRVKAECYEIPITWYSPTGVAGCTSYGPGIASWWQGPGVARNDCVWPWNQCTPITITSLDTGRSITVTPTMYCDCWMGGVGPNGETERIVDLDRNMVLALGLDLSSGLFRVEVQPVSALPDTRMQ